MRDCPKAQNNRSMKEYAWLLAFVFRTACCHITSTSDGLLRPFDRLARHERNNIPVTRFRPSVHSDQRRSCQRNNCSNWKVPSNSTNFLPSIRTVELPAWKAARNEMLHRGSRMLRWHVPCYQKRPLMQWCCGTICKRKCSTWRYLIEESQYNTIFQAINALCILYFTC